MRLRAALEIEPGAIVAFVGAGGKTSALTHLARECATDGLRVLATTTTRVASDELALFDRAVALDARPPDLTTESGQTLFVYNHNQGEKAIGIAPDRLASLIDTLRPDVTLIEADGARRLPLKLPKAHEPVLPPETTLIVHLANLNAIGQPLDEDHIYNAANLAAALGLPPGTRVTVDLLARALRANLTHVPAQLSSARAVVLLNTVARQGAAAVYARRIARQLMADRAVDRVLIGASQADDPVAEVRRRVLAIVLAAGMSRRMGQPKMLLPWGDQTVLERVLSQLNGAVDDTVIITGAQREPVEAIARAFCADCLHNPDYAAGEMLSSLKIGLRALIERDAQAALVVLGDQPMIRARNVHHIMRAYAQGQQGLVAPSHHMRRGHPILIDRRYWQALLDLPADGAPRDVINRHADDITYVDADDSVLRDIDTPEAYQEALRRARLD